MRPIGFPLLAAISVLATWSATAATRPRYGGTLRIETGARMERLDPREWPSNPNDEAATTRLASLVFERLVRLDGNGQFQPALAVSWQHDADSKRWQFRLRTGTKFHDGSLLGPQDVATSLDEVSPALRRASVSGPFVVIQSEKPAPHLLAELARGHNFVFHATSDGHVVGTGAFRIAEWHPRGRAVLSANEAYWAGRPFLDSITVEMGIPPPQQVIDLELGKADIVELGAEEVRRAAQGGAKTWSSEPVQLLALVFEGNRPLVRDERVRQAVALTIDRASIVNVLLQKQGESAGALLPQWVSGYAFLFPTTPDLERARKLGTEISPPPRSLTLGYPSGDAQARAVAERIRLNVRDAGITLRVSGQGSTLAPPDVRLVRLRLSSPDAREALDALFARLGQPGAIPPAAAESAASDPEQLYAAERALLETYRVVPVVFLPETYGLSPAVKNWMAPRWGGWRLEDVWLETAPAAAQGEKP